MINEIFNRYFYTIFHIIVLVIGLKIIIFANKMNCYELTRLESDAWGSV